MSYSIGPVRGETKAALLAALAEAFDTQVLPNQPIHKLDRDVHLANVERQLALLPDYLGMDNEYAASMNGYMSYFRPETPPGAPSKPEEITSAGFGCSVGICGKPAPKA